MKGAARLAVQFVLALGLIYLFFLWIPWLVSQPIESISEISASHGDIPSGARSFTVSHGKVNFRMLGTVGQEPLLFGVLTSALVVDFVLLILSFPKDMRGRPNKGSGSFSEPGRPSDR